MSLRFLDGFDHYTSLPQKYEVGGTGSIGSTGGRNGNGYYGSSEFRKTLTAKTTWIVGCAFRLAGSLASNQALISWYQESTGSSQITLTADTDNYLRVRRGSATGTVIGTSTNTIQPNVWYYIELKATIHSTAGSFELRINGATEASASGINTRGGSADATDRFGFSSAGATKHFDDLYICDGDGSSHNDFLGDCKILTVFPTGAGNYTQWTPSAGSNWQNVDESPPNEDTDYNSTAGAGNKDSYAHGGISLSGSVKGVQILGRQRKDDAGSRTTRLLARLTGDNFGPNFGVSDSYTYDRWLLEANPEGGAWDVASVNAMQPGIELVS